MGEYIRTVDESMGAWPCFAVTIIAVLLSSLFAFSALTMAPMAASTTSRAVIMPGLKLKSFLYPACCCATFTAYNMWMQAQREIRIQSLVSVWG